MPSILSLDSDNFVESEGSIKLNILLQKSFLTFGLWVFFIVLSPQKVKNIDTFLPVAAAPFASTKVAKVLSRSSLNRIKVFPLVSYKVCSSILACGVDFSIITLCMPFFEFLPMNLFPVVLHHASASLGKPASVAMSSIRSPGWIVSMLFLMVKKYLNTRCCSS